MYPVPEGGAGQGVGQAQEDLRPQEQGCWNYNDITDDIKIYGHITRVLNFVQLDSMDLMVLYPYGISEIGAHSEIGNLICLDKIWRLILLN